MKSGSPKLCDALGNLVGVLLLFLCVLQEFLSHGLRVNSSGHVVMALVTKDAHQFRSQCLVQHTNDCVAIAAISFGDGAILNMLPARRRISSISRTKEPDFSARVGEFM